MLSPRNLCRWTQLFLSLSLFRSALAATTDEWKSRIVYQTMTDRFARTDGSTTYPCNTTAGLYCGGTWRGTINHLDYIQGMGFDAVMISPIIENLSGHVYYGEAYHGYWPLDLYQLNPKFGTKQDLLDLTDAVHERGMYLLMDTVINNMAYMTNGSKPATNIDYSIFNPFNNADYFHPYCKISNWENFTNAQLCQTGDNYVALPDLYTEHEVVQKTLIDWAADVMKTYSVDGLRIDAAKHVSPGFLKNFVDSSNAFMTGEVLQSEVDIICNYQENYIGSMPNYPVYYAMLTAFTNGNISELALTVEQMKAACPDVTSLVSFSENHDVERIASFDDDISLAKNILAFTILFDGVPMIYEGQEQHLKGSGTPENRQAIWLSNYNTDAVLYQHIKKLNTIRKHANKLDNQYVTTESRSVFVGSSEIAFVKGTEGLQVMTLLNNQGSQGGAYRLTLPFSYNAGTEVTEILTCNNYTLDNQGELTVDMDKGEPRVFYPTQYMEGSGLCGWSAANVTLVAIRTGTTSTSLGVVGSGNPGRVACVALVLAITTGLMMMF
ncbi:glycoside hydrolase superfamily [Penicillium maclennaniae]|uniref:glycoside hydrolase superfamily n=1 Tax=Penicillium maclennaniae TaxID=1343394 RepID=UPI002541DA8F|nr:glycoside hydrolase superfamily [Penicillium maclennaniae]KAJ5682034.1 glycoside hydrolase superfamily [Penicillium maclennaniae]